MELLVYLKLFSCHCILRMTHLIAKITCACNCYSFQLTSCCSSLKYVDGYPGCHSCINQTEAMWQRKTRMPCYAKGTNIFLRLGSENAAVTLVWTVCAQACDVMRTDFGCVMHFCIVSFLCFWKYAAYQDIEFVIIICCCFFFGFFCSILKIWSGKEHVKHNLDLFNTTGHLSSRKHWNIHPSKDKFYY